MVFRVEIFVTLLVLVATQGCSEGGHRTASKRTADQNDNGGSPTELDCESQWALALRQQSQGTQFVYGSNFSSIISENFDRNVVITAASQDRITQSISVTSGYVKSYAPDLNGKSIALEKSKFLQACARSQTQPISILGGQVVVTGSASDTLTLQGRQIRGQRVDMQINNATYGGYQITGTVQMFVSSLYPALPLQQKLTISDCPSLPLINGAKFEDILKSPLPTAK